MVICINYPLDLTEPQSINELNFDKIKSLLGIIVADVREIRTRLDLEHNEGILTIGKGIDGVRNTDSNDKRGVIFPD